LIDVFIFHSDVEPTNLFKLQLDETCDAIFVSLRNLKFLTEVIKY